MSRAHLDSNVVIDLVEEQPPQRADLLDQLDAKVGASAEYVVSDLVRLECRVKPVASGDVALLEMYGRYCASPGVTVVGLPAPVYDRATELRAQFRYGLADALHLAAAVEAGCDAFVTGDRRLSGFPGINVELLAPDLGTAT